ncbi:putative anion transporter 6, chloroplastic [Drosera capensis]
MANLACRVKNPPCSTPQTPKPHPHIPYPCSYFTLTKTQLNFRSFKGLNRRGKRWVVAELRVDEIEQRPASSEDDGSGEIEEGFDLEWPPWRNLPKRYKLIGVTSLAFVICNMDKVNLSIAIIPMSHQFGWNSSVAGLVQSSFFWGYALSQLPGGWLAKIFGGRQVLAIGVLIWSFATALIPLVAGNMSGLVFSRILVGIGEGVSPSAATDLIARHVLLMNGSGTIPPEERSRAVSFVFGGLSVGSVMGLILAPPIIRSLGWESVFYIFGFLGVAWYLAFQLIEEGQATLAPISRSSSLDLEPRNDSWSSSLDELRGSLEDIPWKAFFRSEAVWAMIYAHFCGSWGHFTCLSWLPTYFSEELDLNLTEAAWVSFYFDAFMRFHVQAPSSRLLVDETPAMPVSVLPPLASIFVTNIAAQLADNLISRGVDTTTVRKLCQTIAFVAPALCMTLSSVDVGLPHWEIVGILTTGLALSSFALSGLYCTHQDISPEYASILLGITNTVGAVPGIVGVALTGYLLDSTHSWSLSLFAPSIFFYLTGTAVWLTYASSKPQSFAKTD